jgi:hypothetical protein
VLEEHVSCIFRTEQKAKQETIMQQVANRATFYHMLLGETSMGFYRLHALHPRSIVSMVVQPVARHFSIENIISASSSALMPWFAIPTTLITITFRQTVVCGLHLQENF